MIKTAMKKSLLLIGCGSLAVALFVNARVLRPAETEFVPLNHAVVYNAGADTLTWSADPAHSMLKFVAVYMGISEIEGKFNLYNGKMSYTKPDMSDAKIQFVADVKSIDTDNEQRDTHLKSEVFFAADRHPKMVFKSTSFTPQDKENKKYKLTGKLTIRDVTKDVTFDVVYGGTGIDSYGNTKAGFKATTKINRKDFGLAWDTVTEGVAVVGDEITIVCNIQMKKDKDKTKK